MAAAAPYVEIIDRDQRNSAWSIFKIYASRIPNIPLNFPDAQRFLDRILDGLAHLILGSSRFAMGPSYNSRYLHLSPQQIFGFLAYPKGRDIPLVILGEVLNSGRNDGMLAFRSFYFIDPTTDIRENLPWGDDRELLKRKLGWTYDLIYMGAIKGSGSGELIHEQIRTALAGPHPSLDPHLPPVPFISGMTFKLRLVPVIDSMNDYIDNEFTYDVERGLLWRCKQALRSAVDAALVRPLYILRGGP